MSGECSEDDVLTFTLQLGFVGQRRGHAAYDLSLGWRCHAGDHADLEGCGHVVQDIFADGSKALPVRI